MLIHQIINFTNDFEFFYEELSANLIRKNLKDF